MGWRLFNPNPRGKSVGDCTVRALAAATGQSWERIYAALCAEGMRLGDMPSANAVWGAYLHRIGFQRGALADKCPDCYTVADFAQDNPRGVFVLALSGHVVTVIDGEWWDAWDSGSGTPLYFWERTS